MNLNECRICMNFDRLILQPLDNLNWMIDLKFGEKEFRFKYPQDVPHVMPISFPLAQTSVMTLTLLMRLEQKYKKVARGTLTIFPKDLNNDKFSCETMLYLETFERKAATKSPTTNILKAYANKGQIFVKVQLLDSLCDEIPKPKGKGKKLSPVEALKAAQKSKEQTSMMVQNNMKMAPLMKGLVTDVKTTLYKDNTTKENKLLKDMMNGDQKEEENLYEDIIEVEVYKEEFYDGCSNASISVIDGIDENRNDIENMNIGVDILLEKIRIITDQRLDDIIPQDPDEMKLFIEEYANKVGVISQSYFRNLKTLSEINNGLKFQAKDFYEKYKEVKKTYTIERSDLKTKMKAADVHTAANIEENNQIHTRLEDLRAEVQFFKYQIGAEDDTVYREEDYQVMLAIINGVKKNGGDIFEGLDEYEQEELTKVMKKYQNDLDLIENAVSTKLEAVINDLFLNQKVIKQINVAETDVPDTFKFDHKTATLFIEDDVLRIREKGFDKFEDWLILHFPKIRMKATFGKKPPMKSPSKLPGLAAKLGGAPAKKSTGSGLKPKPKPK